jgi:hypothetical protein
MQNAATGRLVSQVEEHLAFFSSEQVIISSHHPLMDWYSD